VDVINIDFVHLPIEEIELPRLIRMVNAKFESYEETLERLDAEIWRIRHKLETDAGGF